MAAILWFSGGFIPDHGSYLPAVICTLSEMQLPRNKIYKNICRFSDDKLNQGVK